MATFSIYSNIILFLTLGLSLNTVEFIASENTLESQNNTTVAKAAAPIVLDNATVELKEPKTLSCSFVADNHSKVIVYWFKNEEELNGFEVDFKTTTTTLKGISSTYDVTNYTCAIRNIGGRKYSSKTFLVYRTNYMLYVYVLAAITAGSLLALFVEWTKRLNKILNNLNEIRSLKEHDPVDSSSIQIDKNQSNWRFLASGAYGEVWLTIIKYNMQLKIVVLKTFKYVPFLNPKAAELLFGDLKTEIQICQKLNKQANKGPGSQYIVQYEGFYAQSLLHLKVYLILEHCEPGQLENFLHQCVNDDIFFNDIDVDGETYLYNERLEQERETDGEILGMSHLMKWAEQIALAMTFIHRHNIVHRDLAARNILLKGPHFYDTFDNVIVQLADFGMSRDLGDTTSYLILEGTPKPRHIPVLWYPPESVADDVKAWDVGYDKKSDVWSFGILLWELFSLGCPANIGLGPDINTDDPVQIKTALMAGQRLKREYLQRIPDDIWLLMECCWDLDPAARPHFREIYEDLNRINSRFGLYQENDANQNLDLDDSNDDDSDNDVFDPDAPSSNQKLVQPQEQNNIIPSTTNTNPTKPGISSMSHLTHKHNFELEDKNIQLPEETLFMSKRINLHPNVDVVSFIPSYVLHDHVDDS